jgi:hypothetical protein
MAKKTTPILGGAYLVVGLIPGPCGSQLGEVDLSRLTLEKAERLVQIGFPYLIKAPVKPPRTKRGSTKKA